MSGFSLSTSLRLSQQQKLSPQMLQSINILALPVEELRERIFEEVEKNPALEIVNDKYFASASDTDSHQAFLESLSTEKQGIKSLQEHLLQQLSEIKLSKNQIDIGNLLIQSLDSQGFFQLPLESLKTAYFEHNKTENKEDLEKDFEKILKIIQNFDPIGVCCENIQESLIIQGKNYENPPELALDILENHFDLLETPRPALILKKLMTKNPTKYETTSQDDVEKSLEFIQSLEPFPARDFSSNPESIFITPDLEVREATAEEKEEGYDDFIVELKKGTLPKIRISKDFEELGNLSKDAKSFVNNSKKDANWFISAIEQRTLSIFNIGKAIVSHQMDFFRFGEGNLKPLKMSQIAEEVGVHEATVSRIANGKYLICKWGIFELRYFFTNAATEENDSKESIKHKIKLILENHEKENATSGKTKKLSDEKIATILKEQGINIARRTVAKYRSELDIKSSFDR